MGLFSNFLKKEEDRALGIDIGSSAIKIVQIKKKGAQAALETYGELALGPYAGVGVGQAVQLPAEKIAAALSDLMKEKEVNVTTRKCAISIPFSSALMSIMDMPRVGEKELATMVPLEARKYIPVPIQEVMLDWSLIPQSTNIPPGSDKEDQAPKNEKVEVLVVAIHKETISRYQQIAQLAGLNPGFFEIEIFSTQRSVVDDALRPVMVMDIGAASTKLYVIERGLVRLSHTVNRGSQDITSNLAKAIGVSQERAEVIKREMGLLGPDKAVSEVITIALDYIFAEASATILAFEKKYNKVISKVILVGGGSALKGLAELSTTNLKTVVEAGNPFGKLSAPAFLENILRQSGPEFAVAIGLALRRLSEE